MSAFTEYIKSTRTELRHVAWPTQSQTLIYTGLVIGVSIAVGLYIGFFDFLFTRGLEDFVGGTRAPVGAPATLPEGSVQVTPITEEAPVPPLELNPVTEE